MRPPLELNQIPVGQLTFLDSSAKQASTCRATTRPSTLSRGKKRLVSSPVSVSALMSCSLRKRSPFSITALVLVGCKIEDAGRPESELQKKCREHAEMISKNTLFSPIARVEMIQAQSE